MIEISKGSKVKYELDKKTGLIKVIKIVVIKLGENIHAKTCPLEMYTDFFRCAYAG